MGIQNDIKTIRAINVYQSVLQEQSLDSNRRQEKELSRIKAEIEKSNQINQSLLLKYEKEQEQKLLVNYLNYQLNKLDIISKVQSLDVRKYFYLVLFDNIYSDLDSQIDRIESIQDKNFISNEMQKHFQLAQESKKITLSSESIKSTLGHYKSYEMMLSKLELAKQTSAPKISDVKVNKAKEYYNNSQIIFWFFLVGSLLMLIFTPDIKLELSEILLLLSINIGIYFMSKIPQKKYNEVLSNYEAELSDYKIKQKQKTEEISLIQKEIEKHPFLIYFNKAIVEYEEIKFVFEQINTIDEKFTRFMEHIQRK